MRRANYEVQAEWISLEDPDGHTRHFAAGDDLPRWVNAEQIESLLATNAVQEFGVLGHVR